MRRATNQTLQLEDCACFNLRKATRAITQHYDQRMKSAGLRGTQFTTLAVLSKAGVISITQLADFLIMDRTTVTRNLRPLEKQGFLKIVPGDDHRVRQVQITKAGLKKLETVRPLWESAQSEVLQHLGQEKFSNLLDTLSDTIVMTR